MSLALAALLATGLAACGDDDGGGDEAGQEDASGSASGSGTEEDSGGGSDVEVDDIPGISGDCAILAEAAIAFGQAFAGEGDADFDDLAEGLENFGGEAPEELQDDLEVLADAYREFAEALGDFDFNDPEAASDPEFLERLTEAGEVFNEPEVQEASANLDAFASENCQAEG